MSEIIIPMFFHHQLQPLKRISRATKNYKILPPSCTKIPDLWRAEKPPLVYIPLVRNFLRWMNKETIGFDAYRVGKINMQTLTTLDLMKPAGKWKWTKIRESLSF